MAVLFHEPERDHVACSPQEPGQVASLQQAKPASVRAIPAQGRGLHTLARVPALWPDPTKALPSNLNGYGVQGAVPGPPGGPKFVIPNSINIQAPAVKQAATACHDD